MSVKQVKVKKVKKGDIVYKDGKEYRITNIIHDTTGKRYLIDGEGGYFASIPEDKNLTIKK